VHENLPNRQLILGVDRLDYSKGIPNRLQAYADFLERHPEMHGKVSFIQVVVPSRMQVGRYEALRDEIEQLVGRINGRFTRSGWVPIFYIFRSLDRIELLGYYRSAEVALITPLKDGMNLVAKEYCASSLEEECVLILSESAGAAAQLRVGALLVNPHDVERTADAIHRALTMPAEERRSRMHKLRRSVRERDVFWWVDLFLRAAFATDLSGFPLLEEQRTEVPATLEAS
jgi:trehalose 6-phosphate synthase